MKIKFKISSFLIFAIFTAALLVQDIGFSSYNAVKENSTTQFSEVSKSFTSKPSSSFPHCIFCFFFIEELEEDELFNRKNNHPVTLLSDILYIFYFRKEESHHYIISQTFTPITSIPLHIKNCIYLI